MKKALSVTIAICVLLTAFGAVPLAASAEDAPAPAGDSADSPQGGVGDGAPGDGASVDEAPPPARQPTSRTGGETGRLNIIEGLNKEKGYQYYIEKYAGAARPLRDIRINAAEGFTASPDAEVSVLDSYEGSGKAVHIGDVGSLTYEVDIPEDGLYNISIMYLATPGRSANMEKTLYIDGEKPFNEATGMAFQRVWEDKSAIRRDNRDNDIRPSQVEKVRWQEEPLRESQGLFKDPFLFYLTKGRHTLELESVRESGYMEYIRIYNEPELPTYAEVKAGYAAAGHAYYGGEVLPLIEAEITYEKSDPTLYPIADRTNPLSSPSSTSKNRINSIGGVNWRKSNMWSSWLFDVPEDGLYKLGIKYCQNYTNGLPVTRSFMLDGGTPFREMEAISFPYSMDWKFMYLGDEENGDYLFYLTKGTHELKVMSVIDEISQVVRHVKDITADLTTMYTKMIMVTGIIPDVNKDYLLHRRIADLIPTLTLCAEELKAEIDFLNARSTEFSGQTGTLDVLYIQLLDMIRDPDTIPARITRFNDNVINLGIWPRMIMEQPLLIDYFVVAAHDEAAIRVKPNILESAWHTLSSFIASFTEDYSAVGSVEAGADVIKVWVSMGQEQANTLKAMIDEDFTPNNNIGVNINIMQSENVLLFATASGKGPDVALGTAQGMAVDYGIRNALEDLSVYPGFAEVATRFQRNALVPLSFMGKVFALPQTADFPMLFVREDILANIGVDVPDTWAEVLELIAKLQENNLQFGPGGYTNQYGVSGPNLTIFNSMYFQMGGKYFDDEMTKCILDEPLGVECFKWFTQLFTNYGLTAFYDGYFRFRMGAVPVLIAPYSFFNQLSVAATELNGLWGMYPLPGTRMEDGTIDRTISSGGMTIMVILRASKNKDSAWKFIDWWTSESAQARYGREIEAVIGNGARYNSANMRAVTQYAWPSVELAKIMASWDRVEEIPVVPGSYFIFRHMTNAYLKVTSDNEIPREALETYVKEINLEITKKREEFGLI
ncbi:MAG: extracellular solute-binding protein [Oscillospiraceae bacterium]|nr:extracellular solute-binding protein [Oscillospiraceae bacterium]